MCIYSWKYKENILYEYYCKEFRIDDIGFVEVMIDSLKEELNIDLSRVYASGYSNGGYLIYGLACRLSNKIAAVGSVAGTMLVSTQNNCAASAPVGVINIHGTADYDVPYNGTTGLKSAANVINYWSELNQAENEEITENNGFNKYDYNDLNGDTYVRHFKIINCIEVNGASDYRRASSFTSCEMRDCTKFTDYQLYGNDAYFNNCIFVNFAQGVGNTYSSHYWMRKKSTNFRRGFSFTICYIQWTF